MSLKLNQTYLEIRKLKELKGLTIDDNLCDLIENGEEEFLKDIQEFNNLITNICTINDIEEKELKFTRLIVKILHLQGDLDDLLEQAESIYRDNET